MNSFTYFLSANSCSGYTSFFDEHIRNMRKIIVLKNITKKAKKSLFESIFKILDMSDISYDTVLRCGSSDETDAVILRDLSTVIADMGLFVEDIPLYADIVDFGEHISLDFDVRKEADIIIKRMNTMKTRMYSHLNDAKLIHDDWEKIYISNMDFDKINNATDALIDDIFAGASSQSLSQSACNLDRFFGTLLPKGNINLIDKLTCDLTKRIFIKGRPGTGKSTLLKKVISIAHQKGYSTETYYCSFDPKSLDMVVIRELSFAIFDSTQPHEIYPERKGDNIFDIYDIAVRSDTDEMYGDELMRIAGGYNQAIKKARECMYTNEFLREKYDEIITDDNTINRSISKVISLASLN